MLRSAVLTSLDARAEERLVWVSWRRRRWGVCLGRAEPEEMARSFGSHGDGAFGVSLGRAEAE